MLKYKNRKTIDVNDWDNLVSSTYGKPYSYQQQDGCKERGSEHISIPDDRWNYESEMNDDIPFMINGDEMGVKFETWLKTKPEEINEKNPESYNGANNLFWDRNFYPHIQTIANDLHAKGLIEAGDYVIDIDW